MRDHSHRCERHTPGDRACYNHGCGCRPCTDAASRYRRYHNHGITRRVPVGDILPHLARLYAAGMIRRDIEQASGVHESTLRDIEAGRLATVTRHTAARILSTRPTPGDRVPAAGAARRLQALAWLGWTADLLAPLMGVDGRRLRDLRSGRWERVARVDADRVAAGYDQLWNSPPPDSRPARMMRTRAAHAGWLPPMVWDDDPTSPHSIDNPQATPAQPDGGGVAARVAARIADVEHLLASAASSHTIARQLGYRDRTSLAAWLRRHDRGDLAVLFERKHAA